MGRQFSEHSDDTSKCCMPDDVTITVKNTFVHICSPEDHAVIKHKRVLRLCKTEPADLVLSVVQKKPQDTIMHSNAMPLDPSRVPMSFSETGASCVEPPRVGTVFSMKPSGDVFSPSKSMVTPDDTNSVDAHSEVWDQSTICTPPQSPLLSGTPTTPDEMWAPLQTRQWDKPSAQLKTPLAPETQPRAQLPESYWELSPLRSPPESPFTLTNRPSTSMVIDGFQLINFKLRRADGVGLGLDMMFEINPHMLIVRTILPGGALDAWNRQCVDGPMCGMCVMPGDTFVCVNGKTKVQEIMTECKNNILLKLCFARLPSGYKLLPAYENDFNNKNIVTLLSRLPK